MKYIFTLVFLYILVFSQAASQIGSRASATLSGTVSDGATNGPMSAATVSVTDVETGNIVTGTLSGQEGNFEIRDIPFGIYNIGVSFIGYTEVKIDNVEVTEDRPFISLGTITLNPSDITLDEVEVVSEKAVIENRFDKTVYNVASDPSSQGALAIDVLRKVPQVTVDADGNVELQGNSNIKFLINGKESSIFGNNLADALASIPASQIKSIETITNPGARYDLQGTGGVINIILQNNKLAGVSGSVNLSAGTRNQNGSVNLGVKRGRFGVNGYFSGNWRLGTDGLTHLIRESFDSLTSISTLMVQDGVGRFERNGYRGGVGIEWDITDKATLSGTAGYNNFRFGSSGLVITDEIIYDPAGNPASSFSNFRNFSNDRESSSVDWNLDFKKRFGKEGHELDVVLNSSYGRPETKYLVSFSALSDSPPTAGTESKNSGTNNTTTFQVDYVYPFANQGSFEAGVKTTFNNISSPVVVNVYDPAEVGFVYDSLQSYELGYRLNVYAAYLSAGFRLFPWLDFKPGVRYEYSDISIDFPGASVPSYGTLVPTILFSQSFAENKTLQLTYSRRIRRPSYNDLNPFIDRSDPYNIQTGNVQLRPEVGERIELGYSTGFSKGGNLRISLSQGFDYREIEDVTTFYPEYMIGDSLYRNVSVTINENIGRESNTGLNLFGSVPITSKFNLRTNIQLFHSYINSTITNGTVSTGFRFRGNLNATWQLPWKFMLEGFGFWRSGGKGIQGREPQFYIYNFALRKLFWNDNASFGLVATNVFARSITQERTVNTENSLSKSVREIPFRSFGASFSYKFGKMNQRDRNRENGNNVDDFGGGGPE